MMTSHRSTPDPARIPTAPLRRLWPAVLLALALLAVMAVWRLPAALRVDLAARAPTLVTVFLGTFFEAVPFLLAGSLVSGLIHVFVDHHTLHRFIPRSPWLATLAGALLGLVFAVCEHGVVPITRRLYRKGLPVSSGIAFLLAAPVINPVVILSTLAALGWGPLFLGRLGVTFVVATAIGLLFQLARPDEILAPALLDDDDGPDGHAHAQAGATPPQALGARLLAALLAAGDDFLDMSRYLVLGAFLAAAMQTLVPRAALLALGRGPLTSVLALQALAYLLSVCSTVDAFLSLAFVGTFTTGSILGFLTFGPMVDIKSTLMFLSVFRRRTVVYLIALPLAMTLLAAVVVNMVWVG
jgi:hypothetical protein